VTAGAAAGARPPAPATRIPPSARLPLAILALAALLRLLHLAGALRSPLTWNPGPDEDFYLQFARQVAAGGMPPVEFAFMDPLYGWLAGALFALAGPGVFALYLLQALVDVGTAWLLYRCGRELGRPRAALLAAAGYALCATALMFTTTALKATWVAAFVALWTFLALRALAQPGGRRWLLLGLLGGLAVGLRSNLLLVALCGVLLLPSLLLARGGAPKAALGAAALLLAGTLAGLAPWAALNARQGLGPSPLPYNGGVVLHHLYNDGNPEARSIYPAFVAYRHPLEIWRGYRREAERRAGGALAPRAVSRYWGGEARRYIAAHPGQTARNMLRKLGDFVAYPEVPNNRVFAQEAQLSPVLRVLPAPFPWILALGLPGLVLLLRQDRRAAAVWLPLLVCLATIAVFFAEDRFRFHAVPTLVLGSALALDQAWQWISARRWRPLAGLLLAVSLLLLASYGLAQRQTPPRVETSREAWGWLRMGDAVRAEATARAALARGERDAALHELLGFLAAEAKRPDDATTHYRAALALRPRAHATRAALAASLEAGGDAEAAIAAWQEAIAIAPEEAYLEALARLFEARGRGPEAVVLYRRLVREGTAPAAARARAGLARLCPQYRCPTDAEPAQ
jgi:4-amino-4-deoxy-L-arabinose transferase-like glycosyltransferase